MALCDVCGNFDDQEIENDDGCFHLGISPKRRKGYQPDLYYYWDAPIEELYYWRDAFPDVDCMCEICFDIANEEKKIIWTDHQVCQFKKWHNSLTILFKNGLYYKSNQRSINATNTNRIKHDRGRNF